MESKKGIIILIIPITPISKENNNCEFFDEDEKMLEKIKVADVLTRYIVISMYHRTNSFEEYLECGLRGKNICTFSFGGKAEHNKGWRDFIIFEYDNKINKINPKSIQCIMY